MFKRTALSVLFVSSVYAVGCGGSDSSAEAAQEKLQNPTGSFTKDNASAAFTANTDTSSKAKSGAGAGALFGASNGREGLRALSADYLKSDNVRLKAAGYALRALDGLGDSGMQCGQPSGDSSSASVDCTCGGGGTASIEMEAESDGSKLVVDANYDQCKIGDVTLNLSMNMLMTKEKIITFKKPRSGSLGGMTAGYNVLMNMVGDITTAKESVKADIAYLSQDGCIFVSVEVSGTTAGSLTFGTCGSDYVIQGKNGEWTCSGNSCVSSDNGEKFDFTKEGTPAK